MEEEIKLRRDRPETSCPIHTLPHKEVPKKDKYLRREK